MSIGSTMPFRPTGTVILSASTASSNVPLIGGGESVVVTNTSSSLAYIRFGADGTLIASAADMPVLPNSHIMLGVNSLISYAAAILTSGSGSVLLTRGDGSYL